jgi:hypothetical protein
VTSAYHLMRERPAFYRSLFRKKERERERERERS